MRRRLHLTFPEHLIDQPIIYRLGREFEVAPNIRRANVEERFAWVILELEGEESAIERASAWLTEQGIQLDPISEELS